MIRRILIVEGNEAQRSQLEICVADAGFDFTSTSEVGQALSHASEAYFDLILCDAEFEGIDGSPLSSLLGRRMPDVPIVLIGTGTRAEISAQALREGAFDGLRRPVEPASLSLCLSRASDRVRLRHENLRLRNEVARHVEDCAIVAASDAMIDLLEALERSAGCRSHVLMCGERGTGKEVLARALHQQSPRRAHPFVTLECAKASEPQLESALFGGGHASGSRGVRPARGRLVESNGGMLFFDEIAALPPNLQERLLGVIREEQVQLSDTDKTMPIDVRLIAASARDLHAEVEAGRFNAELLARFESDAILVPPLRERRQDIPLLVDHFLAKHRNRLGEAVRRVSDDALASLVAYDWPGNVRELENLIERAVILSREGTIDIAALRSILPSELPVDRTRPGDPATSATSIETEPETTNFALKPARQAFEARFIRQALAATGGNRTHAAKLLSISHRALLYKLKEYGIKD